MRHLWKVSLLGLPLLLLPTQVYGWGKGSYARKTDLGNKCVISFGSMPQAGPWYLYWPYEAHFNVSAPPFGSGCAPCGMSWGWMGGNYNNMGWDSGAAGGAFGGGMGGGYGGYGGGAPCYGGSCMNYGPPTGQPYPSAPQTPALARPNTPTPGAYPAGFQQVGFMNQVPSYWYGR
jgi:hypothetical protein